VKEKENMREIKGRRDEDGECKSKFVPVLNLLNTTP
jgi:hypothetical protein